MKDIRENPLFKEIRNGFHIQELEKHPGWKLIKKILKLQRDGALEELVDVECTDYKTIQKLQNEIWRYDELSGIITDIITIGKQAEEQLKTDMNFEE